MSISLWQQLAWAEYLAEKLGFYEEGATPEIGQVDTIYAALEKHDLIPSNTSDQDVRKALETLANLPSKLILPDDAAFRSWTELREYAGSQSAAVENFRSALYSGDEGRVGAVSAKVRQLVTLLRSSQSQATLLCDIVSGSKKFIPPEETKGVVDSFLAHAQLQHHALDSILKSTETTRGDLASSGVWLQPPLKDQYPDDFLLVASYLFPVSTTDSVSDPYHNLRLGLTEATAFRFISRALLNAPSPKSAAESPEGLLITFRLAADKRDVLLLRFLSFVFPDIVSSAPNVQQEDVARLVRLFSSIDPGAAESADTGASSSTLPPDSELQAAAAPQIGDAQHFQRLLAEAAVKVQIENAGKGTSDERLNFVAKTMEVSKHTISTLAWLMCQGAEFPLGTPVVDACNVFLSLDLDSEEAVSYLTALSNDTTWVRLYIEQGGSDTALIEKIQRYQKAIGSSPTEEVMLQRLAVFVSAILLDLIAVGHTEYVEDLHFTASSRGDPEMEEMVKLSGNFLRLLQPSKGSSQITSPRWSWKDALPFIAPVAVALAATPISLVVGAIAAVAASSWGTVNLVQKAYRSYQAYAVNKEKLSTSCKQIQQLIYPILQTAEKPPHAVSAGVRTRAFVPPPSVSAPGDVKSAPLISVHPDNVVFFVTGLAVKKDEAGNLTGYTNQPSTQDGDLTVTYGRVSLAAGGTTEQLITELQNWTAMKLGRPAPETLSWISLEEDDFWAQVKAAEQTVRQGSDMLQPGTEPLLLSHGYNVSFTAGVTSAAILRKRMKHKGPIVLFNWPSRAQTLAYLVDFGQIGRSVAPMIHVIKKIEEQSSRILLVGHSMGCELATRAVSDDRLVVDQPSEAVAKQLKARLAEKAKGLSNAQWAEIVAEGTTKLSNDIRKQCHQFAFAAADVDFEDFVQRAKKMATKGVVTLYCSEDRALLASRSLRLVKAFRFRAGDRACLAYTSNFHIYDTIDTDHEGVDPVQHSWIFRSDLAPTDVAQTFAGAIPPRKEVVAELVRRLTEKDGKLEGLVEKTEYFELRPLPK